jgi:hypothetical protein
MTTGTLRKEGTQVGKVVVDDLQGVLLENILTELKILNLHMAILNGQEITMEDI